MSRRIPRKYFSFREFEEEAESQPRMIPVSDYAARFLESVAQLRGIPAQQVLDEIIAYHHVKGEIDTEMKSLFEEIAELDFSKLTPEAMKVAFGFLNLAERYNRLQTLAAIRMLNAFSMVQPIQVVQQVSPTSTPSPPAAAPSAEIPVETAPPSMIPESFRERIENAIVTGFEKYLEKVCQRIEQPEPTDIRKIFQEEMMPMVKQMVSSISSILMNMTQPKPQQVVERPPSEEEKKIIEALQ